MTLHRFLIALAACVSASTASRADVLVVNCQQSGCGPTLAQAVAYAHDGDVVLVRTPLTSPLVDIVLDGKGIAIVAETAGSPWIGSFTIRNVPPGSTALLSGFGITLTRTALLQQNAGSVRIQDCALTPIGGNYPYFPQGLQCTECADVAFLRSSLRGRNGGLDLSQNAYSGSPAIQSAGCTVAIHDSSVRGGLGYNAYIDFGSGPRPAGSGSAAITFSGGSLVLQSSYVQGGRGGQGLTSMYGVFAGGTGGAGIRLTNGSVGREIGGRTLGGLGGYGGDGGAPDGVHGLPVVLDGGTWSRVPGPHRAFVAPRIAHAGEPLVLTVSGAEGEQAVVAGSIGSAHADVPGLDGVLLLQAPIRRMVTGFVGADGTVQLGLTTPDVPGGAPNGLLYLQPVLVDAVGGLHLGCAQIVVHLQVAP